jgi:hypothetical protein
MNDNINMNSTSKFSYIMAVSFFGGAVEETGVP